MNFGSSIFFNNLCSYTILIIIQVKVNDMLSTYLYKSSIELNSLSIDHKLDFNYL